MDHIFALKICEAGEIRGFIMLSCAGTEAEILMLAVTPAWRRQGLAQALIRKAAIFARVRGADRLFLEVGEDNGPARRLYDKLAFKEVGRRPGYYPRDIQPPVDAILLAGTLL
jgi:ribosomal-protein-alanine N-acetyltransferase